MMTPHVADQNFTQLPGGFAYDRPSHPAMSFNRWADFVRHAAVKSDKAGSSAKPDSGDGWSGTASMDETVQLATFGWEQGLRRMTAIKDRVLAKVQTKVLRPLPVYDTTGDMIDVGAFLGGQPECFVTMQDTDQKGEGFGRKVVSILCNISVLGDVKSSQIFNRGAGVVAALEVLETNGYSVEAVACSSIDGFTGGCGQMYIETGIKGAGETLDADLMAFAMANPSAHRRLMFGARETFCGAARKAFGCGGKYGNGYGRSTDTLPCSKEQYDFYVPVVKDGRYKNEDEAEQLALTILGRFGLIESKGE